jgi:hypothetical protein
LPDLVNLCAVTRDAHLVTTHISVKCNGEYFRWLEFGSLTTMGDRKSFIGARYEGVTDFEHDSAYAVRIEVIDVQLVNIYGGCIELKTWVSAEDERGVSVPRKSILSFDELGAVPCEDEHCVGEESHLIVESFSPANDVELWKRLRGRELRIEIVPKRTDSEAS